jgi:hypothetical protein
VKGDDISCDEFAAEWYQYSRANNRGKAHGWGKPVNERLKDVKRDSYLSISRSEDGFAVVPG